MIRNKKRVLTIIIVLTILIVFTSIAFAALSTTLNITNKHPAYLDYTSMETSQRDIIDRCTNTGKPLHLRSSVP